ncbi:MAG: hypothetical protein M0R06_13635 [Sphaerochaeta sp.]|jgi:hypothetical protein|nr:hypothetical protein [Sphaerochaeta sp.]
MTAKLRATLISAAAIVAVVVGIVIAWGQAEHRAALKWKGASAALASEYNAYVKQAEPVIAGLQVQNAALQKDANAAISKADTLESTIAEQDAAISHLKTLTAALSPDGLSAKINERIGTGSIVPTKGGLYICSRAGAEATLNRFIDGEGYRTKYETEKAAVWNLRAALDAAEQQAANSAQAFTLMQGERDRALVAWDADKDALRHLERSILGRRTKSFIIGAATGAAAMLIYQLAKGK